MAEQARSFLKLNLAPHGPLATKSDATCCATSEQRREHHPHKTKRSTCTLVKMTKPIKKSRFFASDMGSLREQEGNKVVLKPRGSEPQTLRNQCNLTHRYEARKLHKKYHGEMAKRRRPHHVKRWHCATSEMKLTLNTTDRCHLQSHRLDYTRRLQCP